MKDENIRDLQLAAARRPGIALRYRLHAPLAIDVIDDQEADRHVGGNHLPCRARLSEFALEPGDLFGAEEIRLRAIIGLACSRRSGRDSCVYQA